MSAIQCHFNRSPRIIQGGSNLTGLIRDAGYKGAEELAEQLSLVMEGAIVFAHVMGERNAAIKAKQQLAQPSFLLQVVYRQMQSQTLLQ